MQTDDVMLCCKGQRLVPTSRCSFHARIHERDDDDDDNLSSHMISCVGDVEIPGKEIKTTKCRNRQQILGIPLYVALSQARIYICLCLSTSSILFLVGENRQSVWFHISCCRNAGNYINKNSNTSGHPTPFLRKHKYFPALKDAMSSMMLNLRGLQWDGKGS